MAFVLRFNEEYRTGLVAVCDVCGKQVDKDGLLFWKPAVSDKPPKRYSFAIVCKGACDRVYEHVNGWQCSTEMDVAIVHLINNTETDIQRAMEKALVLGSL